MTVAYGHEASSSNVDKRHRSSIPLDPSNRELVGDHSASFDKSPLEGRVQIKERDDWGANREDRRNLRGSGRHSGRSLHRRHHGRGRR